MQVFPEWSFKVVLRQKPLFEGYLSGISPSESP